MTDNHIANQTVEKSRTRQGRLARSSGPAAHLVVERLPGAVIVGGTAHGGVGHGEAAEAGVVEVAERVGSDLGDELLHHGGAAAARRRGRLLRLLLVLPAHSHLAVGGPGGAAAAEGAAAGVPGRGSLCLGGG